MSDVPVLTAGASKIASQGSQGQPRTSRIEMKKRLFLNGRNHGAGDFRINERVKLSLFV